LCSAKIKIMWLNIVMNAALRRPYLMTVLTVM
jgi:hypothetical protein